MKSVTLKDVAKAANVSYATVSRALSGSTQIGSGTRKRILKLCDEMGYTTNYIARSMVMNKTNLIVPQNPESSENIRQFTEQVPTVFLSENLRDQPQSYVFVDNSCGTYLGMQYLYKLGHRDIIYFGKRNGSTTHQLRAEGYLRACEEYHLKARILSNNHERSSVEYGYLLAKELFKKPVDYTAIFASTDSNALGILKAADEAGIRIPDQISLIGFDNISSTALPRIDLTTIDQPKSEMAVQAVKMLLNSVEDRTRGYIHQILMPRVIERSSCRAVSQK